MLLDMSSDHAILALTLLDYGKSLTYDHNLIELAMQLLVKTQYLYRKSPRALMQRTIQ